MPNFVDLTGKIFGRLSVVKIGPKDKAGNYSWECVCSCGKSRSVASRHLVSGFTQSCGCYRNERVTAASGTHGMTGTRFYKIYKGICTRTRNKNSLKYPHYGGRGIKCAWRSFEDFKADMYASYNEHVELFGEKDTSIDRINVNGDYSKDNCRWATTKEQASNKQARINCEKCKAPYAEHSCYSAPCVGCKDGHASFWKTVTESAEWQVWYKEQQRRFHTQELQEVFDIDESTECGWISPGHWNAFIRFLRLEVHP